MSAASAIRALGRRPMTLAGLAIVGVLVAAALAAPLLPLADPDLTAPFNRLAPPGTPGHPLGTDHLGRDVLVRVLDGLRVSLGVGVGATAAAALAGSAIGLVAAYYGRFVDGALMRAIDVLMAFPYLLLALAIVAALGPGLVNAALAIAVANVPFFARAARGAALVVVRRDYVDAARLAGFSDLRILLGEVLPNVAPLLVVACAGTIGWMILETAGLSFLGLGAQPPQADLGSMLGDGRKVAVAAPHVAAAAGVVVLLLVIGLNLLGDGLRDLLDPRLKAGAGGAPQPATAVERASVPPASDLGGLLDVRGLTTAFDTANGRHAAVRDVSFALEPGEALGVVGESGSGKSVAALSLNRLAPTPPGAIVAGRVGFRGDDLLDLAFEPLRALRGDRVAYVFQDPLTSLNPVMRVGDQILEALRPAPGEGRAGLRARMLALIADVGLEDSERAARAFPHELSGGQRQRIGVAMAIANRPDVLVADEPTTALDAMTQIRVLELMGARAKERGAALLFVSHDFGVVAALCDRVIVMYAGEIVEEGPTREVLRAPRHPYARRLIACAPRLGEPDRALEALAGAPPPIDAIPRACAFSPRCDHAIEACRAAPVALEPAGEGRRARCLRWRELADA
ncbi:dipeptide/oligopeptide/nickel ABC transporter permease/ATP-binding protein [Methylopila turkensis]|uniref:Peptide ABC transporter permease n=1 Tax=Methylopila turkensis TaxID=1437816 RepID=A0A9W6N7W5_9HYPH|nr:dipeptide/oligopeptide/nickel ABC transporter permease/ATP-binding protein [Methylopila turkensis]GLK81684.1 peptide ABC transporter permease [Methylopila turkensis]